MNNSDKLRIFHLSNHIVALGGIAYFGWSPWLLCIFLGWFLYGCLGISIGYHRLLSHRSFPATPPARNLFLFFGCLATGGSPLSWGGAHRMHHAFCDTEKDPHSLAHLGAARTFFHIWNKVVIERRFIRDLLKDKYIKFLHRNYFAILICYVSVLFSIDPRLAIFFYCWPAVLNFYAFGVVNLLGHGKESSGDRDSSTNSWVANLLTWGEGWHKNHHRFPSSHRIGTERGQIDIAAWVIENIPGIKRTV